MTTQNLPIITITDGQVTTLSVDVAAFFEKQHKDVLRAIENILDTVDEKHKRNFAPMLVNVKIGGGAMRKSKAYRLTRDGFTFLAMGFTGEKAQAFKWAYIDAFNRMEEQLRKQQMFAEQDNTLISNEQQYEISSHVMRKTHALFGNRNYSAVYRALKRRFRIPRYTCLLNRDYETALKFIDRLTADDFSLPDMPEEKVPATPVVLAKNAKFVTQACKFSFNAFSTCEKSLATVPAIPAIPAPASYSITESEMKAIKAMVYYFDDLFKPLIQWAEKEAFKQNHPLASRFYDVWHEPLWFLGRMKQIIERNNA